MRSIPGSGAKPTTIDEYLAAVDDVQRPALERLRSTIRCWHLNDSRGALGSRVDRHEHIGKGCIGDAGFANVLSDPRFFGLPMILETPKEQDSRGRDWDAANLKRLISRAK